MNDWRLIKAGEAAENWNRFLGELPAASPFQTFEWGEFRRNLGWKPFHFAEYCEDGSIVSMVLVLVKKIPLRRGFVWCIGGPVAGNLKGLDEGLVSAIKKAANLNKIYFRIRFDRGFRTNDSLDLSANGWTRSHVPMASGYSFDLDLNSSEQDLRAGLSGKWRRNLKRSEEKGLIVTRVVNPDVREVRAAFSEMESAKGLKCLFSEAKLKSLFKNNRSNFVFFECRDEKGRLLACRGALVLGAFAIDYLAVTTPLGRNQKASFLTTWQVLMHCKKNGIRTYDLGGIDPSGNPGVFTFKKETGARPVEYLGEWDWADSNWMRLAGNYLIGKRKRLQSFRGRNTNRRPHLAKLIQSAARIVFGNI